VRSRRICTAEEELFKAENPPPQKRFLEKTGPASRRTERFPEWERKFRRGGGFSKMRRGRCLGDGKIRNLTVYWRS